MSRLSVDALRVFATIAVVLIHGTSFSQEPFRLSHDFFSDDFLAVAIGQFSRFSVPVFLILSGYGLSLRYGSALDAPATVSFFRRRASKIAVPFLVWTIGLLVLQQRFPAVASVGDALWQWPVVLGRALLRGNADYHLYFFSIILQCYLLFPLLVRLPAIPLMLFAFALQLSLSTPLSGLTGRLGLPALPSSAFVFWLGYFCMGIVSARYESSLLARLPRWRWWLGTGVLLGFVWLFIEYVRASYGGVPAGHYDHFNRLSVTSFSIAVWLFLISISARLHLFLTTRQRLTRAIAVGTALSFSIYLLHPWVLRATLRLISTDWILILNGVLLVATFALVFLLDRVLRRPRMARTIMGLSD